MEDREARTLVESWTDAERRAVTDLLAPELARGWIPGLADLRAAIAVVRERALHG